MPVCCEYSSVTKYQTFQNVKRKTVNSGDKKLTVVSDIPALTTAEQLSHSLASYNVNTTGYNNKQTNKQTNEQILLLLPLKRKERKSIYTAPFTLRIVSKCSDMDHSFTCKLHHVCLSFVSVHHMAPPLTVVAFV